MSRLLRILGGADESRDSLAEPPDWLWNAFGGTPTYSGKSVSQNESLGVTGVYAAVRLLATQLGSLPLVVYRGETQSRERATDAWQWQLLKEQPNPEMAADLFYETLMGHLQLWGNFYCEKQFGQVNGVRRVVALWPISPALVTVSRDPVTARKRYAIRDNDGYFYSDTILHGQAFGTDGLKGLSPIQTHRQMLGGVMARDEYLERFYANQAQPSGVLQVEGTLSDEAAQRLKANWEAAHRGAAQSSRVAVLEDGVTWQTIGMPLQDQQYIEQKVNDINECARIFQIPPEMLGGERNKNITYANVESMSIHFKVYSLNHWLVRIENVLRGDPDLFNVPDLWPEFLSEGMLRGDASTRVAFYSTMYSVKAMTVNEIRARENLPPVPWGDDEPIVAGAAAPADPSAEPVDPDAGDGVGDVPTDDPTARNGHRVLDVLPMLRL